MASFHQPPQTLSFQRFHLNIQKVYVRITCDICGKPCQGQGTQGQGRNQRPVTFTPTPRPATPLTPNRHPGLVPVCSAHIHQSARNLRVHHAARPPPDTSASSPIRSTQITKTHRGTYQPNEPNWPSHIHTYPTYTMLPGPHQTPRPRIRITHALKTQTTSPKTLQIHSISPKWSALWAHTVQLEARRRRHNGCAYDLHHCGARTLHHRCK